MHRTLTGRSHVKIECFVSGAFSIILACLCAGCGNNNPRELQSITINPSIGDASTVASGQVQFIATGHYSKAPTTVSPVIRSCGVCTNLHARPSTRTVLPSAQSARRVNSRSWRMRLLSPRFLSLSFLPPRNRSWGWPSWFALNRQGLVASARRHHSVDKLSSPGTLQKVKDAAHYR